MHEHVPWHRMNPIEFQGQRSRWFFVSGPKFTKLFSSHVEKIVVDNAVLSLSIAWSVPEIFVIKVQSCLKSSALLITHELRHLAWWNFARTCISTTSRTLLNFKVKGQGYVSFLVFFCVHNAAATRRQYLALGKVWWSCSSCIGPLHRMCLCCVQSVPVQTRSSTSDTRLVWQD